MIKRKCLICNKVFYTYPCRVKIGIGKFCSRECYSKVRNKQITKLGKKFRFKKGHKPSPNRKMLKGAEHSAWKGELVGYRGLHYWLYRVKGIPTKCEFCGVEKTIPRSIQWANIDHKYRRNPDDYIALCVKCHKKYDLNIKANSDY